jgi:hypothetical protein
MQGPRAGAGGGEGVKLLGRWNIVFVLAILLSGVLKAEDQDKSGPKIFRGLATSYMTRLTAGMTVIQFKEVRGMPLFREVPAAAFKRKYGYEDLRVTWPWQAQNPPESAKLQLGAIHGVRFQASSITPTGKLYARSGLEKGYFELRAIDAMWHDSGGPAWWGVVQRDHVRIPATPIISLNVPVTPKKLTGEDVKEWLKQHKKIGSTRAMEILEEIYIASPSDNTGYYYDASMGWPRVSTDTPLLYLNSNNVGILFFGESIFYITPRKDKGMTHIELRRSSPGCAFADYLFLESALYILEWRDFSEDQQGYLSLFEISENGIAEGYPEFCLVEKPR